MCIALVNPGTGQTRYVPLAEDAAKADTSPVAFLLIRAPNEDGKWRYLLQHRAEGTWGLPGGHAHPGESPWDAAVREAEEEMGVLPPVTPAGVLARDDGGRPVHTFLVELGEQFQPVAADPGEADGHAWFRKKDIPGLRLNPGMADTWDDVRDRHLLDAESWADLGKFLLPGLVKVGPKGYIHGWIYVGTEEDPAAEVGKEVNHPELGQGYVTAVEPTTSGAEQAKRYHAALQGMGKLQKDLSAGTFNYSALHMEQAAAAVRQGQFEDAQDHLNEAYKGMSEAIKMADEEGGNTAPLHALQTRITEMKITLNNVDTQHEYQARLSFHGGEERTVPYQQPDPDAAFRAMFDPEGGTELRQGGLSRVIHAPVLTPPVDRQKLNARQKAAIEAYTAPESNAAINGDLRTYRTLDGVTGYDQAGHDLADDVKQLDQIIASYQLKEPVTTYRGIALTPALEKKMKPGAVFTDKSFVSTSTMLELAQNFAKLRTYGHDAMGNQVEPMGGVPVVMNVHVPAGAHMGPGQGTIGEYVLPRGSMFHVDAVNLSAVTPTIDVSVVP